MDFCTCSLVTVRSQSELASIWFFKQNPVFHIYNWHLLKTYAQAELARENRKWHFSYLLLSWMLSLGKKQKPLPQFCIFTDTWQFYFVLNRVWEADIATAVLWGPLCFVLLVSGGENCKLIANLFCKDVPLNLAKLAVARINMNHTEQHGVLVCIGVYRCVCVHVRAPGWSPFDVWQSAYMKTCVS